MGCAGSANPSLLLSGRAPGRKLIACSMSSRHLAGASRHRGGYLPRLSDRVISAVARNLFDAPAPTAPLPSTVQNLWCLGGAISEDFAEDSVAFSREGALWFWEAVSQWDGESFDAAYKAWADQALADVSQDLLSNGYVNLTMDMGPEWLRGLYGSESKYQRLLSAKRRWDPENLLQFNKNFKT